AIRPDIYNQSGAEAAEPYRVLNDNTTVSAIPDLRLADNAIRPETRLDGRPTELIDSWAIDDPPFNITGRHSRSTPDAVDPNTGAETGWNGAPWSFTRPLDMGGDQVKTTRATVERRTASRISNLARQTKVDDCASGNQQRVIGTMRAGDDGAPGAHGCKHCLQGGSVIVPVVT